MAFLFASQNVPTDVIKCLNSPYKTWLALFICASYCSKKKKNSFAFWRNDLTTWSTSFWGFIWLRSHSQAARLTSLQPKEETILIAFSSDVWSTVLQANPCYLLSFKREKGDVILSLINTNIKLEVKVNSLPQRNIPVGWNSRNSRIE